MKAHHDQHFLIDPQAVQRIADVAEVKGNRVLEIGPGHGALTRALLQRGAFVHAVELDGHLCEGLKDTFSEEIAQGQLTVEQGDATRCDLPHFEMVVSNLPYSASSNPIFRSRKVIFDDAEYGRFDTTISNAGRSHRVASPCSTESCP